MNSSPILSLIIPTYNRKDLLTEAISSIIKQSHEALEIIVIDDGSTDSTQKYITKNYPNIKYYYQKNKGVSSARNFGAKKSTGEYLLFLDSDDLICANTLENLIKLLKNNNHSVVYYKSELVDSLGNSIKPLHNSLDFSGNLFPQIIKGDVVAMGQYTLLKSIFFKLNGFNTKNIYAEDWEFLVKLSYQHEFFFYDKQIVKIRSHEETRAYNNQIKNLVSERLRILNEIFGSDTPKIMKDYIKPRVLADWHRSAGFSLTGSVNSKEAKLQFLKSLSLYPFQPKLYIWLFNRCIIKPLFKMKIFNIFH